MSAHQVFCSSPHQAYLSSPHQVRGCGGASDFYLFGRTDTGLYVHKIGSDGVLQWRRQLDPALYGSGVMLMTAAEYVYAIRENHDVITAISKDGVVGPPVFFNTSEFGGIARFWCTNGNSVFSLAPGGYVLAFSPELALDHAVQITTALSVPTNVHQGQYMDRIAKIDGGNSIVYRDLPYPWYRGVDTVSGAYLGRIVIATEGAINLPVNELFGSVGTVFRSVDTSTGRIVGAAGSFPLTIDAAQCPHCATSSAGPVYGCYVWRRPGGQPLPNNAAGYSLIRASNAGGGEFQAFDLSHLPMVDLAVLPTFVLRDAASSRLIIGARKPASGSFAVVLFALDDVTGEIAWTWDPDDPIVGSNGQTHCVVDIDGDGVDTFTARRW